MQTRNEESPESMQQDENQDTLAEPVQPVSTGEDADGKPGHDIQDKLKSMMLNSPSNTGHLLVSLPRPC